MPADQRLCCHDGKCLFPVEEPRPKYERQTRSIRQSPWPDLMLLVVGQLFSKKQNLCSQSDTRSGKRHQESGSVAQQFHKRSQPGAKRRAFAQSETGTWELRFAQTVRISQIF